MQLYAWSPKLKILLAVWIKTESPTKHCKIGTLMEKLDFVFWYTENPRSWAYTQHWVLYTWDELIMSISQVRGPLHDLEEDLSRSYLIWTLNLRKLNFDSAFPEYVWGVCCTHVFQENVSTPCCFGSYICGSLPFLLML